MKTKNGSLMEVSKGDVEMLKQNPEKFWKRAKSKCHSIFNLKGLKILGSSLFAYNNDIETITIPDEVERIYENAFSCCDNLKRVDLPKNLKSIGNDAFLGCKNLSEIALPGGLKSIGNGAFYHCESLKEITIPESVEIIESSAFGECENLTTVTILGNIKSFSPHAFYKCPNIQKVILKNKNSITGGNREILKVFKYDHIEDNEGEFIFIRTPKENEYAFEDIDDEPSGFICF